MKKLSLVIIPVSIVIIAAMLLTGCGWLFTSRNAGALITKTYEFTNFNEVDIGSAFRVDILYGDTYNVQITTNENYFKDIIASQSGDTLRINVKPMWGIGVISQTLEAKITMPELTKLTLSGASKGTVSGFKFTTDFSVKISGASKLNLDMETAKFISELSGDSEMTAKVKSTDSDINLSGASELMLDMITGNFLYKSSGASDTSGNIKAMITSLHLSGASSIKLSGSGGDIDLSGSGASSFKLDQYRVENIDIELGGASQAYMTVNGTIRGSLSGGSELLYNGNPIIGEKLDISGGSKFERRK